jgi:hypothetical protein
MSKTTQALDDFNTQIGVMTTGFLAAMPRPHALEVQQGPGTGTKHLLSASSYVLGRGDQATLVLQGDEVSRQHARLTREDGEYTIEDLGSRNGIRLNGSRVHSAVLRDGDHVQIGDIVLLYREGT